MWSYPSKYSDANGEESALITNDGRNLSLVLRGVLFTGDDFDSLEPDARASKEDLKSFTFATGGLCACRLQVEMPVTIVNQGKETPGTLTANIELGAPIASGAIDREALLLSVRFGDKAYRSTSASGWFEDELRNLQSFLPNGVYIKACINCAYSDYSPYGHGFFGWMACFRNLKQKYLSVKDKHDLFPILNRAERVQETYICSDFSKRQPNTGYRG